MKTFEFGKKALVTNGIINDSGFIEYKSQNQENPNPYSKEKLKNQSDENRYPGEVTSIPSPYARMHVTEMAFFEYNCSNGNYNSLTDDYKRAISHCLDIFEILFVSQQLDLKAKGIDVKKVDLAQSKSLLKDNDIIDGKSHQFYYLKTLELYRKQYCDYIAKKKNSANIVDYYFDFTSLYLFYRKIEKGNKVFAATSPFTGFFAKPDCDLKDLDIRINNRTVLCGDANTWTSFDNRSRNFNEFLYSLLQKTRLCNIFTELTKAIECFFRKNNISNLNNYNAAYFDNNFNGFNIDDNKLQTIIGIDELYVRPEGLDKSYLKYLLYLQKPINLSITTNEYKLPIEDRRFPGNEGDPTQWIGPNDFLADALYVLPTEINENYLAIPYTAYNGETRRSCLLPLKLFSVGTRSDEKYDLFNKLLSKIKDNVLKKEEKPCITINENKDGVMVVECRIQLANNDYTVFRREYKENPMSPAEGKLFRTQKDNPLILALGLYPFIYTTNSDNVYKALFYNNEKTDYDLQFFTCHSHEGMSHLRQLDKGKIATNQTVSMAVETSFSSNLNRHYYHIDCDNDKLEFVNMKSLGNDPYSALLIPILKRTPDKATKDVIVAIDLGTSNTYVAYSEKGSNEVKDINTEHDGIWREMMFLNTSKGEKKENSDDLYFDDDCLKAQLAEFMPSCIKTGKKHSFPIPTAINILPRINDERSTYIINATKQMSGHNIENPSQVFPLVDSNIPFDYYENGSRKNLDDIEEGNVFKWFVKRKNGEADITSEDFYKHKGFCWMFVEEILFLIRCHLLCEGYNLEHCQLIWSYPLSFHKTLIKQHQQIWETVFKKYISSSKPENLLKTTESASPIFSIQAPASAGNLAILLDIGGGSTDVIGYINQEPQFMTSFIFAGNSLYLQGELNSKGQESKVFRSEVNRKNLSDALPTKLSSQMNYGFIKRKSEFDSIMNNRNPKFLLLFHVSALVFHVAQLSKLKSDNPPYEVFLTGNGSKLVTLIDGYESVISKIFRHVYGDDTLNVKITTVEHPKKKTAEGSIKGFDTLSAPGYAIGKSVVMLGDRNHVYDKGDDPAIVEPEVAHNYLEGLIANVEDFVNMFCDKVYASESYKALTKDQILNNLKAIRTNGTLSLDNEQGSYLISDSKFFQCISLLMELLDNNIAN